MRRRILTVTVAAALLLGGCTGDDAAPTGGADDVSAGPGETLGTGGSSPDAGSPTGGSSPDAGSPTGASSECTPLVTDDDDYAVGDAGTVSVRLEGDRLVLVEVRPAEGWRHEVTAEEATEVEVEFTGPGGELDFDVEIEDGGVVEAEVCRGDG